MPVIIRELRVFFQFRIQLGHFFQESEVTPQPARRGGFGIFLTA